MRQQLTLVDAIAQLQSPASLDSQLAALQHLKNEAIGHGEKKRDLVRHGVVDVLATVLAISPKARGKRRFSETQGSRTTVEKAGLMTDEDEVRLQAILLVNSLANGGPAFVPPILAGNLVQALASTLSLNSNHPRLILATLRALVALADALQVAHPLTKLRRNDSFKSTLCSRSTLHSLAQLLAQRSSSTTIQTQVTLVCRLIKSLPYGDVQRESLIAATGFLDLLAARLSAYHVSQRTCSGVESTVNAALPPPPSREGLRYALEAVCAIVGQSEHRLAIFLHSPFLVSVFPFVTPLPPSDPSAQSPPIGGGTTDAYSSFMESALPRIYSAQVQTDNGFSKAFPALGTLQPSAHVDFTDPSSSIPEKTVNNGVESEFIPWLLLLIRSEDSPCRIVAAALLQVAVQFGYVSKSRERVLAMLVVPLLVGMMDVSASRKLSIGLQKTNLRKNHSSKYAPAALSRIISRNVDLQKAAVDAGIVKKVSTLMKQSFEPIDPPASEWMAGGAQYDSEMMDVPVSYKLDYDGLGPDLEHSFQLRENCLHLVAALASSKDEFRKQLTDTGIINQIIDSLSPLNEELLSTFIHSPTSSGKEKTKPATLGNPISVLIAACYAARALSRSVSLLRTSLIDAGIAKPIFALLKHPNVDVLVAATDVICNLIVEFSPMRKDLEEAGAIRTLCEHAHSADSRIRLASLWALKHLVDKSPNEIKLACFEDLGTGWLVQIINGSSSTVSSPQMPSNFTAEDEIMLDTEEGGADLPSHSPLAHSRQSETNSALLNSTTILPAPSHAYLASIKSAEDASIALRAQADDVTIQAQGLDFLRNLITGLGAPEMIDALFAAVGAQRIFDLLMAKLPQPDNRNISTTPPPPPPPPPEIIRSAIFVLVHIAAGAPRHRQQLIQQTPLLLALFPCLRYDDARIRVAAVWTLNNLTWVDDTADAAGARGRVLELRRLGFDEALRGMREDESLDVKERVGTSLEQMKVRS